MTLPEIGTLAGSCEDRRGLSGRKVVWAVYRRFLFLTGIIGILLESFPVVGFGWEIHVSPLITYPKTEMSRRKPANEVAGTTDLVTIPEDGEHAGVQMMEESSASPAEPRKTSYPNREARYPIPWQTPVYSHFSNQEDLGELMRDFGSIQGIHVVLSHLATGTISGHFHQIPAQEFLDFICKAQNLIWYFDGKTLFLYRSDEIVSRIEAVSFLPLSGIRPILEHLEIFDPRYDLKTIPESGIIRITGPPRYVELVLETIRILDAREAVQSAASQAQVVVRVFPLRYAWADDVEFDILNKRITLPGVATMLRDILVSRSSAISGTGKRIHQNPATLPKLKGSGLAEQGKIESEIPGEKTSEKTNSVDSTSEVLPGNQSFVVADNRLNAVIVRDIRERMPFYEQTIALLDVPEGLVQIQATIIDINSDFLRELGVDWRFQTNRPLKIAKDHPARTGIGFNSNEGALFDTQNLGTGPDFSVTTIIGNSVEYFIGRVHALEQSGNARIISRPSVLTLNNLEAVLEHTQTFYIRVAGQEEVDLFNVSAGTVLRVTPHIIQENDKILIKLAVDIEDGNVSDVTVDEIPIVQKSTIRTQAIILENESLLIGGMSRDTQTFAREGIPCLGAIPGLGMLFRQDQKTNSKMERLFLITPTVVTRERYPAIPRQQETGPESTGQP